MSNAGTVFELEELEEILSQEEPLSEDEKWYAIRTDPWPCPACGEEFGWVTACHHVVIAESADDLLEHAIQCKKVGRNPRIEQYEDELATITLDQWRALGRPVHGVKRD